MAKAKKRKQHYITIAFSARWCSFQAKTSLQRLKIEKGGAKEGHMS